MTAAVAARHIRKDKTRSACTEMCLRVWVSVDTGEECWRNNTFVIVLVKLHHTLLTSILAVCMYMDMYWGPLVHARRNESVSIL